MGPAGRVDALSMMLKRLSPPAGRRSRAVIAADANDQGRRAVAIAMMCLTMVCFTGHDTSAKWLASSLPTIEIVWARYVAAALVGLIVARPLRRPTLLHSRRPLLQGLRSLMLLGSTMGNFLALRHLQLAETATISFLQPLLVALAAGPLLGEWVGPARMAAIGLGLLGVFVATAPGTNAFQPVTLLAVGGVVCNTFYALLTRVLAAHAFRLGPAADAVHPGDRSRDGCLGHRGPRPAHPRPSARAGPDPGAFRLYPAFVDDRRRPHRLWRPAAGDHVDRRSHRRRLRSLLVMARAAGRLAAA